MIKYKYNKNYISLHLLKFYSYKTVIHKGKVKNSPKGLVR